MIELLELKFSRLWQTNNVESDWSNSPRHSSSRQFRSPSKNEIWDVPQPQQRITIIQQLSATIMRVQKYPSHFNTKQI